MRCGCSMKSSNERFRNSTRRVKRGEEQLWRRVGIAAVRGKIRWVRLWRLAPPPYHHRRDGRIGASADRGQRCRLAVGCLQRLAKARQIAKARHVTKTLRI